MATIGEGEKVTQGESQIFFFRIHQFIHQIYIHQHYIYKIISQLISTMPYHFNLVVCPLVNIGRHLAIHPNWFRGFRTVLEFQAGFLDLGKYWKAKNNGESQLAFVNNNASEEGLVPCLRFVIPLGLNNPPPPSEYLLSTIFWYPPVQQIHLTDLTKCIYNATC